MKLLLSLLLFFSSLSALSNSVVVSVAPHKFFVEKIAQDTVKVILIVPASSTPHSFEPAPKLILEASRADMWFRIGEGFEKKAIESLKSYHPEMVIVDLRKGLPLIPGEHHHSCGGNCCSADGADLHIWLSLRLAQIEAQTIAEALSKTYPDNQAFYQANLEKFLGELRDLDAKFKDLFAQDKGRYVMVSHPAYAYFCRDYQLKQFSLEYEGKDPTPQAMHKIVNQARSLKVKTIFTQAQYGVKGAQLVAQLLGATVVDLDPYAEDYLNSMNKIANAFHTSFAEAS